MGAEWSLAWRGITPAWAGKSTMPKAQRWAYGDHPRVGGEKFFGQRVVTEKGGSPPRGRGKAFHGIFEGLVGGITPAWAGKSDVVRKYKQLERDHPRVGGEKTRPRRPRLAVVGSPPRGRGKAAGGQHRAPKRGITPAWAGKRYTCFGNAIALQDHPRVGGEKSILGLSKGGEKGSPPRGRGKAFIKMGAGLAAGITPAWAGKRKRKESNNVA